MYNPLLLLLFNIRYFKTFSGVLFMRVTSQMDKYHSRYNMCF